MTADEAIFKMLVQVLKNQRAMLWEAHRKSNNIEWQGEFACYATETEALLEQVMEK